MSCAAVGVVYVQDDVIWKEGVRGNGKLRDELCGVVRGGGVGMQWKRWIGECARRVDEWMFVRKVDDNVRW